MSTKEEKDAEKKDSEDSEDTKYKLPDILLSEFTPQEVSNMTHLFEELDEDKSGAIDVVELGVLFDKLEEEITQERLREIIAEVDDDDSGELEFPEFMMLMAKFKKGDSKFAKAASLLEDLNATPAAELERQCRKRGLKIKYEWVETRAATSMAMQQEIYNVTLQGEWIERIKGKMVKTTEPRTFQGIAPTTRDSKMAAAQAALSKLKEAIPGVGFESGVIPPSWRSWYEQNLDNGVDPNELLQTFVVKGFIPAKNLELMQMTSVHISMQRLIKKEPRAKLSENGRYIPPEWLDWAEQQLDRGIRGTIVLSILVKLGFRPERNPHLLQLLRASRGGSVVDPNRPKILDFWLALETIDLEEVQRYLRGGQNPNERKSERIFGFKDSERRLPGRTPLEFVALQGKSVELAVMLVSAGAIATGKDEIGRTVLHHAANGGSRAICEFLIAGASAELHVSDNYGDTPLHVACEHGNVDVIKFFTEWQEERLRRFKSGKDGVGGLTHLAATKKLWSKMQDEKLSKHVPRRFPITWYPEFVHRYRDSVHGQPLQTLVEGAAETRAREKAAIPDPPWGKVKYINDFIEHIDPRERASLAPISDERIRAVMEEYGPVKKTEVYIHADKRESIVPLNCPVELIVELCNKVLEQSYVNVRNIKGRTPIFNAVEPLHVIVTERHLNCLQTLIDDHQADVRVKDYQKDSIVDILSRNHQGVPNNWRTRPEDGGEDNGEHKRMEDDDSELSDSEGEESNGGSTGNQIEDAAPEDDDDSEQGEASDEELMGLGGDSNTGVMTKANQRAMMSVKRMIQLDGAEKQWQELRRQCTVVRRIGSWVEYNHEETGMSFYFQQRSGRTCFETPAEVRTSEQKAIGWAMLETVSERKQIDKNDWYELQDVDGTGDLWYRHKQTRQNQWKKPANFEPWEDFVEFEESQLTQKQKKGMKRKIKKLWKKVKNLANSDWKKLRGHSHALRNVGTWVEYRDDETASLYYFNQDTTESSWTKPAVILDLEKRRFAWDQVVAMKQRSERWIELHDRCVEMRSLDEFKEYRCRQTALLFYYNSDERTYAWTKPEVIIQHEQLKFGDEVGDQTIGDWEKVAEQGEKLRQFGEWVEYRDTITGTIFYVNTLGRNGGGAWVKPMEFIRAERRQYGWEILNTMTDNEWKPIRRRGTLMRTVDPWEEYRDEKTGVTYYYHKYKEEDERGKTVFHKPDEVLHFEKERNTWQIRYKDSHLIEKEGPWEARRDGKNPTEETKEELSKKSEKKAKKEAKKMQNLQNDPTALWWTNIENCKVYKKRPPGMDEARLRRKRHEALTREQTLLEWDEFRSGALTLRAVGPWEELKHKQTGILFYLNVDDETYVFQKPKLVISEDINKVGSYIIDANRPEDWRRMRLHADTLRRAADWEEQRDRETQCVFYYNTTTSESLWSKPDVLRENELRERGWQMVQDQTREQWDRMLKQSKLVRLYEREESVTGMAYLCIQCWRDRGTQAIFYHDVEKNETTWTKPDGLLFDEQTKLSDDLPNSTDREWGLVRMRSEKFRSLNAWKEFRDGRTQAIFYYNEDTGHYQLTKPGPVLENEMRKRAWTLVRRQSASEWASLHERSEVLRSVIQFDELRDEETGCIFYCDNRKWPAGRRIKRAQAAKGTSNEQEILSELESEADEEFAQILAKENKENDEDDDEDINESDDDENSDDDEETKRKRMNIPPDGCFAWQKPKELNEYERTERGRAIASNLVPEDWAALRLRSTKLRDLCSNEIKEYRDTSKTGCTFYYNIITESSSWEKPEDALLHDKGIRGWNLIHKYAGKPSHVHCGGLWAEHADAKTGAIYYRNTTAAPGLATYNGGCQWEKPEMLVREEEEHAERMRKGRAMVMYRQFERSTANWEELAKRCDMGRSSHYMHNCGWDELRDSATGVTVYQKAELNGSIVSSKPTAVLKFDREQFYWYLLRVKSKCARVFLTDGSGEPGDYGAYDDDDYGNDTTREGTKNNSWEEYIDPKVRSFLYWHSKKRITQWSRPKVISKELNALIWNTQLLESGRATVNKNAPGKGKRGPSGWKCLIDTLTNSEFYHHQIFGCTWEKPQAIDDDKRNMIREQRKIELQMQKVIVAAETDFNCNIDRAADELNVDIEHLTNQTDEFESLSNGPSGYIDPNDDELKVHFKGQLWHLSELTIDERKFVMFRDKRIELAKSLELEEKLNRDHKARRNFKKKKNRLGSKWKKSEKNRYNMLLFAELAVERKKELYQLCTWGCGEWMLMDEIKHHCNEKCPKRMLPCELGCGLFLRAEFWVKVRSSHEENECTKRMVLCPQGCGRQVVFEDLDQHCNKLCAKRRIPPLRCRMECGKVWIGGMDRYKAMLLERDEHEAEECLERDLPCTWVDIKNNNRRCMAVVKAKHLREHRKEHLATLGVLRYRTPGSHSFTVPRRTTQIKLQIWGAGGGGGHLLGSNNGGGRGGGGGFIEGILEVTPGETLEIIVGEGGQKGVHGKLLTNEMSLEQAAYKEGFSRGGVPGGGIGRSNNAAWAAGSGGGFTAIFRNGPWGKETVLVAGGGGGGGSRNGCPGGGYVGGYTADDPRNGGPGTQTSGGDGGRPPFGENWLWEGSEELILGEPGKQWQGGASGQFGGGGGGGFYGGGGGGSTPGIVGGGGGGSSFASDTIIGASTNVGHKFTPGGMDRNPTKAIGHGEWDEKPGYAGDGGLADEEKVTDGSHGLAVIKLPGFFGS